MTSEMIPAKDGIKLYAEVGLSENTFHRNAREGKIKKQLPEGRERDALYSLEDINRIVDFYRKKRGIRAQKIKEVKEEESKTDWVKHEDLPRLLTLDYEMFGIEETVDISLTHKWFKKNPYMCRVLFSPENRKDVWGYVTIIPMEEEIITRLLKREMHERDIKEEDILTYEKGKSYNCYAASMAVEFQHRVHIRKLINSVFKYWCEQKENIKIRKIYAYADSEEGWSLIKHLYFAPRYDIGPKAFELDPSLPNPSKLIQSFQDCLKTNE